MNKEEQYAIKVTDMERRSTHQGTDSSKRKANQGR